MDCGFSAVAACFFSFACWATRNDFWLVVRRRGGSTFCTRSVRRHCYTVLQYKHTQTCSSESRPENRRLHGLGTTPSSCWLILLRTFGMHRLKVSTCSIIYCSNEDHDTLNHNNNNNNQSIRNVMINTYLRTSGYNRTILRK